jgi:hypothetical protein
METVSPIHGSFYVATEDPSDLNLVRSVEFRVVPLSASKKTIEIGEEGICNDDTSCHFASLSDIHRFDSMVKSMTSNNFGIKLLFHISRDPALQTRVLFLLGCHMILTCGLGFEETYLSFRQFHQTFEQYCSARGASVEQSLRALCCAKCSDWIDLRVCDATRKCTIDKFVHDER